MKQFGLLSLSLLAFACALSAPTAVAQATPAQNTPTAAARLELIGAAGQQVNISAQMRLIRALSCRFCWPASMHLWDKNCAAKRLQCTS